MNPGDCSYIAAPMRGHDCFNFAQFFHWQVKLEKNGYLVINPAREHCKRWIETGWVFNEEDYEAVLEYDCKLIRENADCLFMLKGWELSTGAKREREYAKSCGIPVYYETERK